MWLRIQNINSDPTILPHHKLCLKLSLSTNITVVIDSVFNDILNNQEVSAVIDVSPNSWSTIIQGFVLPHVITTVRYSTGITMDFATDEDLIQHFQLHNLASDYDRQFQAAVSNLLHKFSNWYLFTVGPDVIIPFESLAGLAKEFGWRQIGIVVGYNAELQQHETHDIYDEVNQIR